MKALLLAIVSLSAIPAFAASRTCISNQNGDYLLTLEMDGQALRHVALFNQDWGGAGEGGLQDVKDAGDDAYLVSSGPTNLVGFEVGTRIMLEIRGDRSVKKAIVYGPGGASYREEFSCL